MRAIRCTLLVLGAIVLATGAQAESRQQFCARYAELSVEQARAMRYYAKQCPTTIEENRIRWSLDLETHYTWCVAKNDDQARAEYAARTTYLHECSK